MKGRKTPTPGPLWHRQAPFLPAPPSRFVLCPSQTDQPSGTSRSAETAPNTSVFSGGAARSGPAEPGGSSGLRLRPAPGRSVLRSLPLLEQNPSASRRPAGPTEPSHRLQRGRGSVPRGGRGATRRKRVPAPFPPGPRDPRQEQRPARPRNRPPERANGSRRGPTTRHTHPDARSTALPRTLPGAAAFCSLRRGGASPAHRPTGAAASHWLRSPSRVPCLSGGRALIGCP